MTDRQMECSMAGVGPRLFLVRGHKVMLDEDLAPLYEIKTEALNYVIARNIECFPEDFMFQLTPEEFADLKSRSAISGRAAPYVFTGQGLALLSSILIDVRENRRSQQSWAPACSCHRGVSEAAIQN